MKARIVSTGSYVPEKKVLTNHDLEKKWLKHQMNG